MVLLSLGLAFWAQLLLSSLALRRTTLAMMLWASSGYLRWSVDYSGMSFSHLIMDMLTMDPPVLTSLVLSTISS